jgi:hypothetical protein
MENEKILTKKIFSKECGAEGWVKRYAEEIASFQAIFPARMSIPCGFRKWIKSITFCYDFLMGEPIRKV